MNNVINNTPYLRTSREFPEDGRNMVVQINKAYVDIANAVNNRTISIFPTTRPSLTGESWFLTGNQRQQSFRQVYTFGAIAAGATLTIPTNIANLTSTNINVIFTRIFGSALTTNPDIRPIPYSSAAAANQQIDVKISLTLTGSNIVIVNGAAAANITSGLIVLEWLTLV